MKRSKCPSTNTIPIAKTGVNPTMIHDDLTQLAGIMVVAHGVVTVERIALASGLG